jgi:very-short-patch-repair endonuclease
MDLAAVLGYVRLRAAIEHVIVDRQASFGQIAEVLRRVRRRGKPGVRKLVATLDSLDGEPPPSSQLERLLHAAARRAGVRIVRQHPLPWDREPIVGVVDAAIVESRLILESDGRSWHTRMQDQSRDARRDREAARRGWQTLRFVWGDLDRDLQSAADDIRVTHQLRSRVSDTRKAPA